MLFKAEINAVSRREGEQRPGFCQSLSIADIDKQDMAP